MTEREGPPVRRLRSVRPQVTDETAASILPGTPRVGALDALLREVDGLRLTLETDLGLAAAAVEAGVAETAVALIDGDLEELTAFEALALGHLADLAAGPTRRRRRSWSRMSAAPFVAAAAVVGFLVGVVPSHGVAGPGELSASSVSAQSSLEQLTGFAAHGETNQVRSTSLTLHNQIAALVNLAKNDPVAAQNLLLLLSYERDAIVQSGDSVELRDVLAQGAALAARIRNGLPSSLRNGVPLAPALAAPTAAASPRTATKTSTEASPKAAATPSAAPAAAPSPTASPSSSPKASPTPSGGPGLFPSAPAHP